MSLNPNMCCDKISDIHKTKLTVNMFIILGHVNNYGKNRYLQKFWHAAVHMPSNYYMCICDASTFLT